MVIIVLIDNIRDELSVVVCLIIFYHFSEIVQFLISSTGLVHQGVTSSDTFHLFLTLHLKGRK